MEFTCPETGFTQTFTNQKCNKIRKLNMSENCGALSCACAAELTVAETGKGMSFCFKQCLGYIFNPKSSL